MQTKQIPKTEWPGFLDSFSRKHEGWIVTLEVLNPEIGAQVEETGVVLEGLTDEWDEVRGNRIIITTGNDPNYHITHTVSGPSEINVEQTPEGADVALAIKSTDGTTTLLSFHAIALPETVDAI